ncbi:hypothetical protein GCM10010304_15460 [Streptomyces roseoviolaceus]
MAASRRPDVVGSYGLATQVGRPVGHSPALPDGSSVSSDVFTGPHARARSPLPQVIFELRKGEGAIRPTRLRLNLSGSGLHAETDQFTVAKLIGFSPWRRVSNPNPEEYG